MIKNIHNQYYSSLKGNTTYNHEIGSENLIKNDFNIEAFEEDFVEASQEIYLKEELFSYEKSISHNEEYFSQSSKNLLNYEEVIFIKNIGNSKEKLLFPISRKEIKEYLYNIKNDELSLLFFRENWMEMVSDINKKPSINDACNISLYIMMHFYKKNYLALENSINIIDMDLIPKRSMIIILRYTRIAREKISNWISFRDKCVKELNKRGEDPRKLLKDMIDEK